MGKEPRKFDALLAFAHSDIGHFDAYGDVKDLRSAVLKTLELLDELDLDELTGLPRSVEDLRADVDQFGSATTRCAELEEQVEELLEVHPEVIEKIAKRKDDI